MDGNEKIEQLRLNGGLVSSFSITQKQAKEEEKDRKRAEKILLKGKLKTKQRNLKLWKKAIKDRIGRCSIEEGDRDEIIYTLATLLFDEWRDPDLRNCLDVLKMMFPDIYVDILENYLLGNHDT